MNLLPRAEAFGLHLDPEKTAPFTVRWNAERGRAEILFRETRVAHFEHLHYDDAGEEGLWTQLVVRAAFPREKSSALMRAAANAVTLTDMIGRLDKDEKARGRKGYVTRTPEAFLASVQGGIRTLIGAQAEEPAFTFSPIRDQEGYYFAEVKHGKGAIAFRITEREDGLFVQPADYLQVGPKRAEFTELLERGAARWARSYDAQIFLHDMNLACTSPAADRQSVLQVLHDGTAPTSAFKPVRSSNTSGEGLMLLLRDDEFYLSHNGLFVCRAYFDRWTREGLRFTVRDPIPCPWTEGADVALIRETVQHLGLIMTMKAVGKCAEDYPVLDPDLLSAAVDATDFGYDL